MRIAGAVLAAGGSRRLGQPKQLLPFGDGTLIEAIVARVRATSCADLAVVVGAHGAEVARRLAKLRVEILDNPQWDEGLGSSVRCAARWAMRIAADGLMLCLADQPRLSTAHLERLLTAFRARGTLVGSRYADTLGVPAVFGAVSFAELASLAGDRGARALLARPGTHAIDWPDGAIDIDAPRDLAQLR